MQAGATDWRTGRDEASTSRRPLWVRRFKLFFMHVVIAKPLHNFARHALDQLERGGQDDHCSQPDCGDGGGREGSTGRRHRGCFEILKPAHRNACGLFQPVHVGNRQSQSSRNAQQLRSKTSCGAVSGKNSIGLYGEQMVKAGAAGIDPRPSWPLLSWPRLLSVQSVSKLPRGTTRRYSRWSPVISSVALPFNDAGTMRSSATLPKRFSLG